MAKIELGDLGTWLEAIGTVAAFFLAFWQLEAERKRRREEKAEEQARKVSAWVAREAPPKVQGQPPQAHIAILNESEEPIYEVIATIVRFAHLPREDEIGDSQGVPIEFRAFLSVVPPGTHYTSVNGGYRGMSFQPAVELAFRDRNGKSWVRGGNGNLLELEQSPTEYSGFHSPLSWTLPEQNLPE